MTSLRPIRTPALALISLAWIAGCGGGDGYSGGDAGAGMLPAASLTLSIEPSTIQLGQSATLTWSSDAGNNCSASGDWTGAQPASGTRSITPTATGTQNFTLTCSGSGYSGEATRSVSLTIGAVAVTLAQIQASIFTPRCTSCHDGSQPANGFLPGAMNLNAGASFANLVNVASQQQPSVLRVVPGNPDASYLVRKLEGAPGITGQRMPFGGPFLDAAAIAQVRAWIAAGAPNN